MIVDVYLRASGKAQEEDTYINDHQVLALRQFFQGAVAGKHCYALLQHVLHAFASASFIA